MKNNGIKIMSLEGAWLINGQEVYKDEKERNIIKFNYKYNTKTDRIITRGNKEITIKPDEKKIYTATIPYSLEIVRAMIKVKDELTDTNEEEIVLKDKTDLFINLKFNKSYKYKVEIDGEIFKKVLSKKKIRKHIYENGITIDDCKYVFFKRGASKARTSNCIFVKEKYYDTLYKPCLLGLKPQENQLIDMISLEAYTSLIMSSIIDTLKISRDEILIINDIESKEFEAKQYITKYNKFKMIEQIPENKAKVVNNMTDGQGLIDESLFIGDTLEKATCVLLRNDFLKCNAVRTKIQEYYDKKEIKIVYDMFGNPKDSSKIKLVITPSSCKYLKFNSFYNNIEECYNDWISKIPETFGIVKVDHAGNYGYSNRLSYQMLNSMNLSREEVRLLMEDELKYFKLLKDNVLETSQDIRKMSKKDKEKNRVERNEMSYFLSSIKPNDEELKTCEMVTDLLSVNSNFRFTRKFKDWKNEQLQAYIDQLRLGKIRIKNSLYAIMVSCPYEMLVATTTKDNKIHNCIMDGNECFCPSYNDGEELLSIRNPQINEGNINYMVNKYHDEYAWFGYQENGVHKHEFVVFVNSYNFDIMNRLQGADWDIDTTYLSNNKLLVKKSKLAQSKLTPVNGIEGKKSLKEYNKKELAKVDSYLGGSTMSIGKIVNKSAIFNAYMYNAINNGYSQEYIDKCYEASSKLSSFSQIAIDMAKKNFEGLSLNGEMIKLNKTSYKNNNGQTETILQYEYDKDNASKITIEDYVKEEILADKKERDNKYILAEDIKDLDLLRYQYENEIDNDIFSKEIEVFEVKMVVPYFFKFTASDNSYRICNKMDCSMDYLEEVLDNLDTKAIQTDKINIEDLLVMQKELTGGGANKDKLDIVRKVIHDCDSVIKNNFIKTNDNEIETKKKSLLIKNAKIEAVTQLKELKLNPKTILKILERAFGVDEKYQEIKIVKLNNDGEEITYKDKEGNIQKVYYKELSEMTMTVLTLIYNSYRKEFMDCFKGKIENIKGKRYWK